MSNPSPDLNAALIAAVADGDVARVTALLDAGASPNASEHREHEHCSYWWTDTPVLYVACERKYEGIVELLLARGSNASTHLYRYENMLQQEISALVAAFPSAAIVELLLKAGADPNKGTWQREDAGWEQYPLDLAPTEPIKELLRRYGAKGRAHGTGLDPARN